MTQPTVLQTAKKALITPRTALISTLRTWFLYRDQALWAFVSGAEAEKPLEEIVLADADVTQHVSDANAACQRAWAIAQSIATDDEKKASTVMREAITELLATERPGLLLSLDHLPGTF